VTVRALIEWFACPVEPALEVLDLAHSSYYYHSQKAAESRLETDLQLVAGQFPTYGTRRMTHELRRPPYRYTINRKRVQRIMRENGWLRRIKRAKCWTTNSNHPYPRYPNRVAGLKIERPDQVWVADITYIRLGSGFVYLAVLMDIFTRAVRGWKLSRKLDTALSLDALKMALHGHVPEIHHSDQGIQYAVGEYVRELRDHKVLLSMAAVGKPEENGYAERLMRTIKEEEVDLSDYRDFADAEGQIKRFLEDVYMTKRIHSSLGYLTPAEFEAALRPPAAVVNTP
jgi:transposase InsO family protein